MHVVHSLDDAFAMKRWLGERHGIEALAMDTETGGLDPRRDALRLCQFGDANESWVVRWDMWAGLVHEVFADWQGSWVLHNAAFDVSFLEHNGVQVPRHRLEDTKILAHLEDSRTSNALKPLCVARVDKRAAVGQELLHEGMRKQGWTWATVPYDFAPYWFYSGMDVSLTARLFENFAPVRTEYAEAYERDLLVSMILMDAQNRGMRIDVDYAASKKAEIDQYTDEMYAWIETNYGVKPGSNIAVSNKLLADGVRLEKRTAAGAWVVDSEVLEGLEHPLAAAVLAHRKAKKMSSAYFGNIISRLDGDTLRCSINSLAAKTGRMSVSTPALQQLPSGSPLVRNCFIAREGHTLAMVDYDQIELRLMACFAHEEAMLSAIRAGEDLHMHMARMMFGPNANKGHRRVAKGITFGKGYGAGVDKLALMLGCSSDEAKRFIQQYDTTFPGIPAFMREVERVGHERERNEGVAYVRNPYGRRTPKAGQDGMYVLTNFLIQSTAADVLKQALVDLNSAGLAEYVLLPVHDELIFEFEDDTAEEQARAAAEVMTEATKFAVPLTVGTDLYKCWGSKYAA